MSLPGGLCTAAPSTRRPSPHGIAGSRRTRADRRRIVPPLAPDLRPADKRAAPGEPGFTPGAHRRGRLRQQAGAERTLRPSRHVGKRVPVDPGPPLGLADARQAVLREDDIGTGRGVVVAGPVADEEDGPARGLVGSDALRACRSRTRSSAGGRTGMRPSRAPGRGRTHSSRPAGHRPSEQDNRRHRSPARRSRPPGRSLARAPIVRTRGMSRRAVAHRPSSAGGRHRGRARGGCRGRARGTPNAPPGSRRPATSRPGRSRGGSAARPGRSVRAIVPSKSTRKLSGSPPRVRPPPPRSRHGEIRARVTAATSRARRHGRNRRRWTTSRTAASARRRSRADGRTEPGSRKRGGQARGDTRARHKTAGVAWPVAPNDAACVPAGPPALDLRRSPARVRGPRRPLLR